MQDNPKARLALDTELASREEGSWKVGWWEVKRDEKLKGPKILHISHSLILRNTFLNGLAKFTPSLVGLISIPFIVRGLGTDRFGLLALTWTVLTYFTLFDFGLGRSTIKHVAEVLGQGELELLPRYVWTTVFAQIVLGLIGSIVLWILVPLLTEKILKIPPSLIVESQRMLYLLAGVIPVLLVNNSFRGVLEAAQRFDYVILVSTPASSATFICPLVGVFLGWGLPAIVGLICVLRVVVVFVYLAICLRLYPVLRQIVRPDREVLRQVFVFGSWLTLTSLIMPIYRADTFFVGSLVSIGAVAYYNAAADMGRRLGILSMSLGDTLFPAFSTLEGGGDKKRSEEIFLRSLKFQYLLIGIPTTLVIVLAHDILRLWLGPEFASRGAFTLQIVALGTAINSLGWAPSSLYLAAGRSDLQAKFHMVMGPIFVALGYVFTRFWGITGIAVVVFINMAVSTPYHFFCAYRLGKFRSFDLNSNLRILALLALFCAADTAITWSFKGLPLRLSCLMVMNIICVIAIWRFIFDDAERVFIKRLSRLA